MADASVTIRVQTWQPQVVPGRGLEEIIGAAWPLAVGTVAEGRHRVLCIGPADWIVVSRTGTAESLLPSLSALAGENALSVVDVSQALCVLHLESQNVRDILARGCALDLHPRVFGAGRCARTRFAHIPIIVHCTNEPSRFDCYLSRSYAPHLTSWLADAGATYRLGA